MTSSAVWATCLCCEVPLEPLRKTPARALLPHLSEVPGAVQGTAAAACEGQRERATYLSKAVGRQTKRGAIVVTNSSNSATVSSPRTDLGGTSVQGDYVLHLCRESYWVLASGSTHPLLPSESCCRGAETEGSGGRGTATVRLMSRV